MATTLQTRIKSKVDTFANWTSSNPTLLNGEIAVVVVPGSSGAVQQEPAVLLKVGDGSTQFNNLKFVSGLAANVYEWALASTKPTYTAEEISGLEDYISGKVEDTNTKYKIEVDPGNPYTYKLSYKELNGEWTVQDTITIPKDTLTEGSSNGTVSFNGTDVSVHGLGSAAYTESSAYDAAGSANTAKEEANSYTDQQIAAKLASTYKAAGSKAFEELPALSASEEGKVYNITNAFTTNSNFVEGAGKSYPAGTNVVCIDTASDVYKWDVLAGMVDLSAYDTASVTQGKIDAAKQEATSYADSLNTAMDSRMDAVEADKHTHTNKALLDTYTQTESNLSDAVSKKHEHSNKTVLDAITSEKVQSWDGKADDSALATIAKTGDAGDLQQTPGEYLIFDCGSATVNI